MSRMVGYMRLLRRKLSQKPDMKVLSRQQRTDLTTILIGLASISAVAAYVFQPIQRFASFEGLFLGGMFIAMGIFPNIIGGRREMLRIQALGIYLILAFAAAQLFIVGSSALDASDWNDRRCFRIQVAMLHPTKKTRSDIADVFTALGCRPQGSGPSDKVYRSHPAFPASAKEQARHDEILAANLIEEVSVDEVAELPNAIGLK